MICSTIETYRFLNMISALVEGVDVAAELVAEEVEREVKNLLLSPSAAADAVEDVVPDYCESSSVAAAADDSPQRPTAQRRAVRLSDSDIFLSNA
jgi:hypothetical protein